MAKNIFRGLGVAMVTPFLENKEVDVPSLAALTNNLIENGVDFLCVLGTTAETATLNKEEQRLVVETVQEAAKKRVPILLGVGTNCTDTVIHNLQTDFYHDIDGVLVVTPYYNKPSQEGLYQHYKAISEATDLPIVLYNVPGRTGVNMEASTTLRLAKECTNIVAIKEASGKVEQIKEIIENAPKGFEVISGDDSLTKELIQLGAVGVISVVGNAYPRQMSELVHAALEEDAEKSQIINETMVPIYKPIFVDGNPSGIKCVMTEQGKLQNVLRLPLVPVRAETAAILAELNKEILSKI